MSNYKNITYYGISNSKTQVDFVKNRFKNNKKINIIFDTYDNLKKHFNTPTINKVFFIEPFDINGNQIQSSLSFKPLLFIAEFIIEIMQAEDLGANNNWENL